MRTRCICYSKQLTKSLLKISFWNIVLTNYFYAKIFIKCLFYCIYFRYILPVEPVNFLIPLEDQVVEQLPGEATFTCQISRTDLSATWKKGDVPIGASDKYEIKSEEGIHTLTVHVVDGEDDSPYSAVFRETDTTAKLIVRGECHGWYWLYGLVGKTSLVLSA